MGVAQITTTLMTTNDLISTLQYRLTSISHSLMDLSRRTADITNMQHAEAQAYMAQYTGEDSEPSFAAIEYVNSTAFNQKYNALLQDIKVKEQHFETEKQSTELRIRELEADKESWGKGRDKAVKDTFKYFN